MPIYEFACEACGKVAEEMQKLGDPPPAACPSCGAGPMTRQVSRTSFQLKGGGWYSDLYASPGAKPAADKPGSESKPGGEGKPDAKPGAAADKQAAQPAAKPATPAPAPAPSSGKGSGSGSGGGSGTTGGGSSGSSSGGSPPA